MAPSSRTRSVPDGADERDSSARQARRLDSGRARSSSTRSFSAFATPANSNWLTKSVKRMNPRHREAPCRESRGRFGSPTVAGLRPAAARRMTRRATGGRPSDDTVPLTNTRRVAAHRPAACSGRSADVGLAQSRAASRTQPRPRRRRRNVAGVERRRRLPSNGRPSTAAESRARTEPRSRAATARACAPRERSLAHSPDASAAAASRSVASRPPRS